MIIFSACKKKQDETSTGEDAGGAQAPTLEVYVEYIEGDVTIDGEEATVGQELPGKFSVVTG